MLGFLDLPPEIRNQIYRHFLPTLEEPALFGWDCCAQDENKHALATWDTCRTIRSELPEPEQLFRAGAVIPCIAAHLEDPDRQFSRSDSIPIKYLRCSAILRVVGPMKRREHEDHIGDFTDECEETHTWHKWLQKWSQSQWATNIMNAFLSASTPHVSKGVQVQLKAEPNYNERCFSENSCLLLFLGMDANMVDNLSKIGFLVGEYLVEEELDPMILLFFKANLGWLKKYYRKSKLIDGTCYLKYHLSDRIIE